jgi:FkbM family methyltransferase
MDFKMQNVYEHILQTIHNLNDTEQYDVVSKLLEMLPATRSLETEIGTITFYIHGRIANQRVINFLDDEPEIFEWFNTFEPNDTVWDIGANVGTYSVYLAKKEHIVTAFEPVASNYFLLSKNASINQLQNKLSTYCIALSDETVCDKIYMQTNNIGAGCNTFGENNDWQGNTFEAINVESVIGFTADTFIEQFQQPIPNHIKIDVDGNEDKVLFGAKKMLQHPNVKSIYIELTDSRETYTNQVIDFLASLGFEFFTKKHATKFDDGPFATMYNYVFKKR